jgi:hypothetical protein
MTKLPVSSSGLLALMQRRYFTGAKLPIYDNLQPFAAHNEMA